MTAEPLNKVYEKFKHLDVLLSEVSDDPEEDFVHWIAKELWRAIKEERASHSSGKSSKQVFSDFIQWMTDKKDLVCLEVIIKTVEIYLAEMRERDKNV